MKLKISYFSDRMPFAGNYLETRGLGGSESCVINLTRNMKELLPSAEITVYTGNRNKTEEYNGVIYKGLNQFYSECRTFDQDAFISLRSHKPFYLPIIDAQIKILHSQDDMNEGGLQELSRSNYAKENIDLFLSVSNYAKYEIEKGFPGKDVILQRNGYNQKLACGNILKKDPICFYSSTPFRGLDVLTELWPYIYAECEKRGVKPKLWVFTGMALYDWSDDNFKGMYDRLNSMQGVTLFGPVPQYELYKYLAQTKVMLYPNTFLETSSMAVVEAIACGNWVVTTDLGALNEQVRNGYNGYTIPGNAQSEEYKNQFIGMAIDALCKDIQLPDCSNLIFSWREQAEKLLTLIHNKIN